VSKLVQKTLAAFFVCGSVLSACKVYPASLLDPVEGSGGSAGSGGAPTGYGIGFWSSTRTDGCVTAGAPTPQMRPKETDPKVLPPIYMAIDSLILGSENTSGVKDKNAWKGYGLDLDGTCTSSETCGVDDEADTPPQTCKPKTAKVPIDGTFCRNNTFGSLESGVADTSIGSTYRLTDDSFNCGLCLGKFTFIVKVSRYNGLADDGDVRVDLYASRGLETPIPFECSADWRTALYDNGLCWQSNQPFSVEQSSMAEPTAGPDLSNATIFDDGAYVRDGYLVMNMPASTRLWFPHTVDSPIYTFPFVLAGGITTGRLVKNADTTWGIEDGVIAGWAKGDDLVEGFERLGFCEGKDDLYPFMKTLVGNNLDISSTGNRDPEVPCDAISLGIPFKARQASVGGLVDTPFPERCAPNVPPGSGGSAGAGGDAGAGGGTAPGK
jgi:hypothetical protein